MQGTDAHSLCEHKLKTALGQQSKDPTENLSFFDEEMAQRVKAVYLRDEAKSILVDDVSYFVKRPFLQRLFESTVRLLSPLL